MAERSTKRRRIEPRSDAPSTNATLRSPGKLLTPSEPLSAFAAARARLQEKSLGNQASETTSESQIDHETLAPGSTHDVERLSDDGYDSGPSDHDSTQEEQTRDPDPNLSTWIANDQSVLEDAQKYMVIRLAKDQTLCIAGIYRLQVREGVVAVSASSFSANPKKHLIVAPLTDPLPILQCIGAAGAVIHIHSEIDLGHRLCNLEKFSPSFQDICTVAPRDFDFSDQERSFKILQKPSDDPFRRPLRTLEIPDSWGAMLNSTSTRRNRSEKPHIVAVVGTTAAGKFRVSQTLLNNAVNTTGIGQLATQVYSVDLDPEAQASNLHGQVSASVHLQSYIGPSFITGSYSNGNEAWDDNRLRAHDVPDLLHLKDDLRAHAFPNLLQQKGEQHMITCATNLLSACLRHAASQDTHTPLSPTIVLSFPDISQGHGSMMTLALLKALQPHEVFVVARGPPKVIEDVASACTPGSLHVLEPLTSSAMSHARTVDETRDMHLLASAHTKHETVDKPLAHRRPLCISYARNRQDFLAVAFYPDLPPLGKLTDLLSVSLISVVLLEDAARFRLPIAREKQSEIPYIECGTGRSTPRLDPATTHLLGVALVRAVDLQRQVLELVPISGDLEYDLLGTSQVVLVHGCFDASRAIISEETYWRGQVAVDRSPAGQLDDSVPGGREAEDAPYLEMMIREQDLKEARWKSRKFNMGGGG